MAKGGEEMIDISTDDLIEACRKANEMYFKTLEDSLRKIIENKASNTESEDKGGSEQEVKK